MLPSSRRSIPDINLVAGITPIPIITKSVSISSPDSSTTDLTLSLPLNSLTLDFNLNDVPFFSCSF